MEERRQFDRATIPPAANIFAEDDRGTRLGRILVLGRGGFLLQTSRTFPVNVPLALVIVAEQDGIRRRINAARRYLTEQGDSGFEFHHLEPDAAVEIGVLIGKYFYAPGAEK